MRSTSEDAEDSSGQYTRKKPRKQKDQDNYIPSLSNYDEDYDSGHESDYADDDDDDIESGNKDDYGQDNQDEDEDDDGDYDVRGK